MEQNELMKEMASRLVAAMEPEEAKTKLLGIVAGGDIYQTILDQGGPSPCPPPRKRKPGGGRRKKALGPQGTLSGEGEQG